MRLTCDFFVDVAKKTADKLHMRGHRIFIIGVSVVLLDFSFAANSRNRFGVCFLILEGRTSNASRIKQYNICMYIYFGLFGLEIDFGLTFHIAFIPPFTRNNIYIIFCVLFCFIVYLHLS